LACIATATGFTGLNWRAKVLRRWIRTPVEAEPGHLDFVNLAPGGGPGLIRIRF